ncbi:PBSX family phage terminase large subunit [Pseudoflavonifractor phocaeensis]|uniref:PBSX family phage terminase large subunit n=1 Tax=Pseudoflavonifractor phocaeensis TaxID=1870988 RepID=UPI00313BF0E3
MNYQKFSKRQLLALTWWNRPRFRNRDAIICDGSVRSGKTLCMAVGFILWSLSAFNGEKFAICGKTIESLRRNVIVNLPLWLEGLAQVTESRSENKVTVTIDGRTNTYYLFGGRDESSYALIQGMTLAGVLLDEVALMPKSFVEQALARCSVAGSKFWFNCNPEGPEHWFKKEWVDKKAEHNALHLHFTMADNPSLPIEIKTRYESIYSGVFYQRYILGEWRVAEGLVYTMFNKDFHVVSNIPRPYEKYYISCDYGTLNPTSAGLWGLADGRWYRVREYYYDARKAGRSLTDEEHYSALEDLAGDVPVSSVIVDPSAASFIEVIRRHGRFRVEKASNSVIDGIRDVATHLQMGDLFICEGCKDCIREFGLYRWDEKAAGDKPIKADDHAMDDLRYFVHTVFAPPRFSFE